MTQKKWEYKQIFYKRGLLRNLEDKLNEYGGRGWELISVIEDNEDDCYNFFFKRPL